MAQISRTFPPIAPATVSSGRLQGGLHTVSTSDTSPVEETGSIGQDGVLFNDALLFQQEDQTEQRRGNNWQAAANVEYAGSTQTFVSIFENVEATNGEIQRNRSKGFANLVARAIDTYETNVQLIHSTAVPRGTNLSMIL
jgi:hypothetical protein